MQLEVAIMRNDGSVVYVVDLQWVFCGQMDLHIDENGLLEVTGLRDLIKPPCFIRIKYKQEDIP